jgi:hypothetical protein
MRSSKLTTIGSALLLALLPAAAGAQELSGMVKRLFDAVTINATSNGVAHQTHFFLGGENLTKAQRQLNVALAQQLTTFPLPSSSGGFTFGKNAAGEIVPTSTTFGPLFAERAVTIGAKKFNFGYTFQAVSFDSFEGAKLDDGSLRFVSQHNNCCPNVGQNLGSPTDFFPEFERDLLLSTLTADITTRTNAFFANYGVSDRFDIGLAVPIVHVSVDATVTGEILRTATAANPTIHSYDGNGLATKTVSSSGTATGLGDVLVRAKYNVVRSASTAIAGALDLRLPTGDKEQLLGTGATQAQLYFIASGEYGRVSPHVNVGYTFSHGTGAEDASDVEDPATTIGALAANVSTAPLDIKVPDEVNYTFGVAVAPHPKVTIGFDLRGRTMRDVTRFVVDSRTFDNRGPGLTLPTAATTVSNEFLDEPKGNLTQLLGVIGGKINIGGTFLLNLNLLIPLNDDGLKAKPTPVVGFDYVF